MLKRMAVVGLGALSIAIVCTVSTASAQTNESEERPEGRFLGTFAVTAHPIEVLDANPLILGKSHTAMSAREVGALDARAQAAGRVGTVADGVSRLLLRVRVSGRGSLDCEVEGGDDNGTCEALAVRPSPPVSGTTVATAIYTPPERFGSRRGTKWVGEVEARDVVLRLTYRGPGGADRAASKRIILARPPLVLVHGTFDSPALWTKDAGGRAFAPVMEEAGFKAFLVNYETEGFLGVDLMNQASFAHLHEAVWQRPGGIKEALDYFRRPPLNLAAARADVVGHSLGGLLSRVYASPGYETPDHPYKRPENFEAGDINRLITLCSPHHGSAVSAMLQTWHKASEGNLDLTKILPPEGLTPEGTAPPLGVTPGEVLVASMAADLALFYNRWWESVDTNDGAVRDQVPGSQALKKIGKTAIPSFAVGCIAADEDADDRAYDPKGEYRGRVDTLSLLFYNAPLLLRYYLAENGMERESFQVPWLLETATQYWMERDGERSWLTGQLANDLEDRPHKVRDLQAVMRSFLFLYDENDFTVGVTSQRGGLGGNNTVDVRGVLHGSAPSYPEVQRHVLELLKGDAPDGKAFAEAGFPEAGADPGPVPPPKSLIERLSRMANASPPPGDPRDQVLALVDLVGTPAYEIGDEAIRISGMVYAHAMKFMRLAEERKTVFMFRPVNPDSTRLIAENNATKPMAIKAKSSDWGPHRGYLPVDQAFSKKATATADTIAKFNCDVYDNLRGTSEANRRVQAQAVPFEIDLDGKTYEVVRTAQSSGTVDDYQCQFDSNKNKYVPKAGYDEALAQRLNIGSRQPLLLRRLNGDKPEYRTIDGVPQPDEIPPAETLPFEVVADRTGKYMTADYDTLAIASLSDTCRNPPFDPVYGGACGWQIQLIKEINAAAKEGECGYSGGDLVHHGPETNYTGSEYIDYPILAFIPRIKDERSRIIAIHQGPDGFRDMHTKRLFFMLQQMGWKIDPNPNDVGWNWGVQNVFTGYDPADQVTFPSDVPQEIESTAELDTSCVPDFAANMEAMQ